jgi:hypothetical protein
MHQNKRLYFCKGLYNQEIRQAYSSMAMEQDLDSPHSYEYVNFKVGADDVVADIGAAEGLFSLNIVERAKKLYLFEINQNWIEALKMTFAPWKNKVEIINKFVSDHDDQGHIQLDTILAGGGGGIFIKTDGDGSDIEILNGAKNILSSKQKIKAAICTYHKETDAKDISEILKRNNFQINFSKGYIFFIENKLPIIRKGLIRASSESLRTVL